MYFEWLLVSSSCYGDSSGQAERDFLYVKSSLSRRVYKQPYISLGCREIARVGGRFSWSWAEFSRNLSWWCAEKSLSWCGERAALSASWKRSLFLAGTRKGILMQYSNASVCEDEGEPHATRRHIRPDWPDMHDSASCTECIDLCSSAPGCVSGFSNWTRVKKTYLVRKCFTTSWSGNGTGLPKAEVTWCQASSHKPEPPSRDATSRAHQPRRHNATVPPSRDAPQRHSIWPAPPPTHAGLVRVRVSLGVRVRQGLGLSVHGQAFFRPVRAKWWSNRLLRKCVRRKNLPDSLQLTWEPPVK